jgi:phage protein D
MVRVPTHYVEIGDTTLDEMGLSDLVTSITYRSSIDTMDSAEIDLTYGTAMDKAYKLLTHGSSVQIYLGYVGESILPVFFGFLKGVQIDADKRQVKLLLASYFKLLGREEKSRNFEGQTVASIISMIASDYPNIEVGEIDNGDYTLTDTYQQDTTDLDALTNIARMTGMHLSLRPSSSRDSTLYLSLFSMGRETKPVEYDPIVYSPKSDQQNQLFNWHLKTFTPESNILGTDVSVSVQSVNPRYDHSTTYTTTPASTTVIQFSEEIVDPDNPGGDAFPILDNFVGTTVSNAPSEAVYGSSPMNMTPAEPDALFVAPGAGFANPGGTTPLGTSIPELITSEWEMQITTPSETIASTTSTYHGTDVVFVCFGETSTVHFSENVTNEEAQARIAEAIQNDSSFSFVVAKNCALADGEASLEVGQRRSILLNGFPLFGDAFSGDYVITAVSHTYARARGFTTTFACHKNSLEIPPEVVPGVGVGAQRSPCNEFWRIPISPKPFSDSGGIIQPCEGQLLWTRDFTSSLDYWGDPTGGIEVEPEYVDPFTFSNAPEYQTGDDPLAAIGILTGATPMTDRNTYLFGHGIDPYTGETIPYGSPGYNPDRVMGGNTAGSLSPFIETQ